MHTRIAPASPTSGHTDRKPNLIAGSGAVDTLQHELKIEGELELADHDDRRLVAAQRDQITAADLALARARREQIIIGSGQR